MALIIYCLSFFFSSGLEVWLLLYYINEEIRLTLIERETHTLHWAIFWFGGGGGGGDGGVVSSSFLERIMLALIFQKKCGEARLVQNI